MTNTGRRKSDGGSSAARSESDLRDAAAVRAADWIARCTARLIAIEPQLSADDAALIASGMHDFERTAAMEPEAAAEFVSGEMPKAERKRFERRTGNTVPGALP